MFTRTSLHRRLGPFAATSLLASSLALPATAATLEQTSTFSIDPPSVNAGVAGTGATSNSASFTESTVFPFDRFDPQLGTLQSVTVSLLPLAGSTPTTTVRVAAARDGASNLTATATGVSLYSLTLPAGAPDTTVYSVALERSVTCTTNALLASCAIDQTVSAPATAASRTFTLGNSDLSFFTGSNTFDVNANVEVAQSLLLAYAQTGTFGVSGSGSSSVDMRWAGSARVVYDDLPSPVPEPGSTLMLAAGMAALGGWTLRRRRSRQA